MCHGPKTKQHTYPHVSSTNLPCSFNLFHTAVTNTYKKLSKTNFPAGHWSDYLTGQPAFPAKRPWTSSSSWSRKLYHKLPKEFQKRPTTPIDNLSTLITHQSIQINKATVAYKTTTHPQTTTLTLLPTTALIPTTITATTTVQITSLTFQPMETP